MPASRSSLPHQQAGSSRVGQLMFLPVARKPILVGSRYILPGSGCTPGGSRYLWQRFPLHPTPVLVSRGPVSVSRFPLRPGAVPVTTYTLLVTRAPDLLTSQLGPNKPCEHCAHLEKSSSVWKQFLPMAQKSTTAGMVLLPSRFLVVTGATLLQTADMRISRRKRRKPTSGTRAPSLRVHEAHGMLKVQVGTLTCERSDRFSIFARESAARPPRRQCGLRP